MNLRRIVRSSLPLVLAASLPSVYAQNPCPQGFEHMGRLYAEAGGGVGHEAKVGPETVKSVALPENYNVDTTYQQSDVRGAGGNEASSPLSPAQVPPGYQIVPSGTESGGCQGWAVSNPQLLVLKRKGRTIVQEALQMNMYCHSGSGAACIASGRGCNATVEVCAKPAH